MEMMCSLDPFGISTIQISFNKIQACDISQYPDCQPPSQPCSFEASLVHMKVEELQLWESVPNTIKFIDQQLSQFVDELSYAMYHIGKLAETVPSRHVITMPCDSCNTVYGCAHDSTVKYPES